MSKRSQILLPTVEEDQDLGGDEATLVDQNTCCSETGSISKDFNGVKGVDDNGFTMCGYDMPIQVVVIRSRAFI